MAKLLIPGLDPDADAVFRKAHGLGPNDPAPVSLERHVLPDAEARNREMKRSTKFAGRAVEPPVPGWTKEKLEDALDKTVARTNFRKKDFFSVPALENRVELALRSLPGARNDTKKHIQGSAPFGNFLFGAEAAAAGLSEDEALRWGRWAQPVQDMMQGNWPSWADKPEDPPQISDGYRYFHQGYRRSAQ